MRGSILTNVTALGISALVALVGAGSVSAQGDRQVIPRDTVVRLKLEQDVSSRSATRGQTVNAVLSEEDTSGFPAGTQFEGVVTEVRRASKDAPAILDMEFRRAYLPLGPTERISGQLASLAGDDVRTAADGRLTSRREREKFDWKWVGIGAGAGGVLGSILGDDFLKGALLGGLGGAIYGYLRRDEEYRELSLERGTEFGMRLERQIAINDRPGYRYPGRDRRDRQQVAGEREEFRGEVSGVYMNGRELAFPDSRPIRVNGTPYLPLQPVAAAAAWDLRRTAGADEFALQMTDGTVRGVAGERAVSRGDESFTLAVSPLLLGDELYVPVEFLSRVGGLTVEVDRSTRRMDLRTDRGLRDTALPSTPGQGAERTTRRLTASQMVDELAAVNYADFRSQLRDYRQVDVERVLDDLQVELLTSLLARDSVARRNQALLTGFMKDAGRITGIQQVVGLSRDRREIYIR